MTTYLMLALTDDGRVTVYPYCAICHPPPVEHYKPHVPIASGTDRNAYSTYEVAGYSIDVRRKEPTNG